jgi:NTE family protein
MSDAVTVLFIGGGNRFPAFIGALKALQEKGLRIRKLIGASTAGIVAALYACGKEPDEIAGLLESLDTESFKDRKRRGLSTGMGLYAGDALEAWLESAFNGATLGSQLRHPLQIITTDMQNYRPLTFSADHHPDVKLSLACRGSAAIPWVFAPRECTLRNRQHMLVDGSLMAGLVEIALNRTGERTLAFKVVSRRSLRQEGVKRGDWRHYWNEIFAFYLHAQEKEFIKGGNWRDNIMLHCGEIAPHRFSLTIDERRTLCNEGYLQTMKYLEYKWGI